MRNLDIIRQQIVELSTLLSAYNQYLASHRSLTEVENATQIQHNRVITGQSLNALKNELSIAKHISNNTLRTKQTTRTITHTEDEKNAILHFNKDPGFTITE